jgi:uncharacterized protein (TIGR03067 family)
MKLAGLAVLALGLLMAADKPKAEDVAAELEKFNGGWMALSIEQDGVKVPADKLKTIKLDFEDGAVRIYGKDAMLEGTLKVDPTTKPKSYEATITGSDGKKTTSYGIYELKGDLLKVCYTLEGKDKRPKEFKSTKGSKVSLAYYKREKEDKEDSKEKE